MDKGKVYSIDWEKYLQPERLKPNTGTGACFTELRIDGITDLRLIN